MTGLAWMHQKEGRGGLCATNGAACKLVCAVRGRLP